MNDSHNDNRVCRGRVVWVWHRRADDGGKLWRQEGRVTADISEMPYAEWLEQTVQELFDICPVCIAMQMIDANGQAFTCYWNVNQNDRAVMMDSMREDGLLDTIRNNRELINAILNGEDGDDDGLCESDTEADSEG